MRGLRADGAHDFACGINHGLFRGGRVLRLPAAFES